MIRIACGNSSDYTDSLSNVWAADNSFTGGDIFYPGDVAIANTVEDELFQWERYGNFSYSITVPNGNYTLNLGFAETFWDEPVGTGGRSFNVTAQGDTILSNYDIWSDVGYRVAVIKSFPIAVTGGAVELVFTTVVDNAKISNIEILEAATTYYASPLVLAFAS